MDLRSSFYLHSSFTSRFKYVINVYFPTQSSHENCISSNTDYLQCGEYTSGYLENGTKGVKCVKHGFLIFLYEKDSFVYVNVTVSFCACVRACVFFFIHPCGLKQRPNWLGWLSISYLPLHSLTFVCAATSSVYHPAGSYSQLFFLCHFISFSYQLQTVANCRTTLQGKDAALCLYKTVVSVGACVKTGEPQVTKTLLYFPVVPLKTVGSLAYSIGNALGR